MMDVLEARYGAVASPVTATLIASISSAGSAGVSKNESSDTSATVDLGTADVPGAVAASSAQLAESFAAAWRSVGVAWVAQNAGNAAAIATAAVGPAKAAEAAPLPTAPSRAAIKAVAPSRPSFISQTLRFARRALIQHAMGTGFLMDCVSLLLGGCVMGIVGVSSSLYIPPIDTVYFNSCPPGAERLCRFQLRVHLEPVTFYTSICIGVLCIPAAVRALGAEREIFWREASVGISRPAYYVGKVLAEVPKMLILAFMFTAPLVAISHYRAPVELYYFAVLIEIWFIYALGFTISAIFVAPDAANLFGVNAVSGP